MTERSIWWINWSYDEFTCDELTCDELTCDKLTCDELTCDELTCDELTATNWRTTNCRSANWISAIWRILIQSFYVKAYKVCMTAGSMWLLVKVSTFNKYDNYLSTVKQYISCTDFRDNLIAVKIRLNSLTIFLRMLALMVTNYRHWSSLTSTRVFLFVMSEMAIETSLLKSSVSIVLKTATANNRLKRHLQIYWKRSLCCKDYTCSHLQNSLNCACSLAISNRSWLMRI